MSVKPSAPTATPTSPSPELLGELLKLKIDVGYRFVGFYTACVTAYLAMVALALKYCVEAPLVGAAAPLATVWPRFRFFVGVFGVAVSTISLAGPVGLLSVTKETERHVSQYELALGLKTHETFGIVKWGAFLSLALFVVITVVWIILLPRL